jgi:hypothetical protein
MIQLLTKVSLLTIVTGLAATASAQEASSKLELMRPGTRAMWATFSVAPAMQISDAVSQLKIAQAAGWHFFGNSSGPAIAFELQESFGSNLFILELGPKFCWDIPISSDLGIYLSPNAMIGMAYASAYGTSDVGLDLQFGFEGKMVLADRGLLFFRPMTLDIAIGDRGTAVRWDIVFGGGVTF